MVIGIGIGIVWTRMRGTPAPVPPDDGGDAEAGLTTEDDVLLTDEDGNVLVES